MDWAAHVELLFMTSSLIILLAQALPVVLSLPLYALALITKAKPARSSPVSPDELEIVVVSKATYNVLGSLLEVLENTRRLLPEYKMWLVIDEDSPARLILENIVEKLGVSILVVPNSYRKGRYKSRAVQYFIDTIVEQKKWYVFLDDDSYPLDRRFLQQLDDRYKVYNGLVYPRRGRSLIAWVADSTRYFHAITRARAALRGLHKPLYGLNGEFLIAKGEVLLSVGFASDSIVEDSLFAARLLRRGIPVGQVDTRVSILSPNSVTDMWRQRARWNLGVLADIARRRYPLSMSLYRGSEAVAWLLLPLAPFAWAYLAHVTYAFPYGRIPFLALSSLGITLITISLISLATVPYKEEGFQGLVKAVMLTPAIFLTFILGAIYAVAKAREILSTFVMVDKSIENARTKPRELVRVA